MSFWQKGARKPKGDPLPLTSCDSFAEAEDLVILHCKLSYGGGANQGYRETGDWKE